MSFRSSIDILAKLPLLLRVLQPFRTLSRYKNGRDYGELFTDPSLMSPTTLPSIRDLFPNLIRPRGDDPKPNSRLITPQLVLDRTIPFVHSERHAPTVTPAAAGSLTRIRQDSVRDICAWRSFHSSDSQSQSHVEDLDPRHGSPPSEAPSPVDADDCHDNALRPRKHVCHICRKRFSRPSSLTIHYHTHTGVRPYRCTYPGCSRTFNVSSNMRRHYKNHEVQAVNRSKPPPNTFRTSFYSPPLHPDVYPPPPLQCGYR
ncbi:hypothetical protein BJ322DRAFT_1069863 [Thelephora terrestris]|uniref:C2H2-type domain-containing protein n=1 Tax=Thelephora terrestris TaxID=56493 RepID=A0A9P6HBC9_9AGAM|nr:hypothetical protein BJ322DRAFT_1069863 [Thelephora terrestris]